MKKVFAVCLMFLSAALQGQELTLFFDFDRCDLNPTAQTQLQHWLADHPNVEVTKIYGFCDWKGSNHYNDSLSIKRVKTVLAYLQEKNILVQQGYEIKGFGEDFPQSKVQSENRKVIINYTQKPQKPKDSHLSEQISQAQVGDKIQLTRIYFANMTARILPQSLPVLQDLLCALEEHPSLKIEIQGHICCQLVYDINDLSTRRAQAVYNYLARQKISRKRLSYKGFGTSKPIYTIPEKTPQEEDANRRVEILILEH
ncbi:OmpA family protein [Flavobacterium sp. CYK-55]|uniref:OmpA family protein n=1 Tax=Flavobacterium sp. CYK-55 TaxID=2835529 RepID=UPI001BD072C0|nr:OmpA family protein [Flavobacterium sp. CYK-55]MBS7786911.1 OmpA family protein [Flavobacterium sp. CYK-55]